jgi:hypothetical protein
VCVLVKESECVCTDVSLCASVHIDVCVFERVCVLMCVFVGVY